MDRKAVDILISGGGLAGLIAAAAFGHVGFQVCLIDPTPQSPTGANNSRDHRSTAFLQPAQALFEKIGLWSVLAPHAVQLKTLRIVDTIGTPPQVRDERAFKSEDEGSRPFGWNFPNWLTRRELLAHLEKMTNLDLRFGSGFRSMITRTDAAIVTLSDGAQLSCRLVIGADGRDSSVRDSANIQAFTTRYGQKSLAFAATHDVAHENISTEIYHQGGPFTMVPLADIDDQPSSAIVWMNKGRTSLDLAALDINSFNAAMNERSAGLFGNLKLASARAIWPIITQRTDRLTSARTALIAEAAHVLPPIGAQGLNTSLNDIAALLLVAEADPADLGSATMLDAYEKARHRDILNRARAIDLFNRVTRSGDIGLQNLRLAGLKVAHDVGPLRQRLVRAGMGPR